MTLNKNAEQDAANQDNVHSSRSWMDVFLASCEVLL